MVRDDHGQDPILIRPDGSAVDTWREGGTINRFTEHLDPRSARVVALTKPTTTP